MVMNEMNRYCSFSDRPRDIGQLFTVYAAEVPNLGNISIMVCYNTQLEADALTVNSDDQSQALASKHL